MNIDDKRRSIKSYSEQHIEDIARLIRSILNLDDIDVVSLLKDNEKVCELKGEVQFELYYATMLFKHDALVEKLHLACKHAQIIVTSQPDGTYR